MSPVETMLPLPERQDEAAFSALGQSLFDQAGPFADRLCASMLDGIDGLPHDEPMRRLLFESVRANVESAARIYRGDMVPENVQAPDPALVYARHLARREAPPSALARAYRWGQFMATEWAIDELGRLMDDPATEVAAVRDLNATNFWYIDKISELVLAEYQAERDRWRAHRSTVKAEALTRVLAGGESDRDLDLADTERALSYRLRQVHVAGVIWIDDARASQTDLAGLEELSRRLAAAADVTGEPLFWLRDSTTAWWWAPWEPGRATALDALRAAIAEMDLRVRLALGSQGRDVEGFRESHRDALLAERVARAAGDRAPALVSATEPGVRAASMLTADLEGARRLVRNTLGGLAADTRTAADLRTTLQVYLEERGSHSATAQRLHIHKNTVGYRLGKASEICGSSLRTNRVDLELALVACQWLGAAVLGE